MRLTNSHNLPVSILNALTRDSHAPQIGRYGVNDLCGSPLVRILKVKHWDELEQDIGDMLWLLLGLSVHSVLEKGAPLESLSEEKLTMRYDDITIVGVPDLWHNGVIEDWKVTSVYSFLLGDKPDWERQLNVYVPLYAEHGFETHALKINAILRDWMKSKAVREQDYPDIPFKSVDVPKWANFEVWDYIHGRVRLHKEAEATMIATVCTDEERWAKPTTYAVVKVGNKRADRVLDTLAAAQNYISSKTNSKYGIETRPGEYTRCKDYCMVRAVCPYNPYKADPADAVGNS